MKKGIIILLFLFTPLIVFSSKPIIEIKENANLYKFLSGKYKLDVNGVITIINPSNISTIGEVNFKLYLDSLIGISKVNLENSSNSNFKIDLTNIRGYLLKPNSTYKVGYKMYGILHYNIFNKTNATVLEYYLNDLKLNTNILLNLQKPEREDYNTTNISNRLITYGLKNPTDFVLLVKSLNIYRSISNSNDSSPNTGQIIENKNNIILNSFESKQIDFFDKNSVNNSIYWISSDVFIKDFILNSFSKRIYNEEKKEIIKLNISKHNVYYENQTYDKEYEEYFNNIKTNFLIKKGVDKFIVKRGESVKVILNIVNLNNISVNNLEVDDFLPNNYEIINSSLNYKLFGNKIVFDDFGLKKYDDKVITYNIINKDKFRGVTYLKPATLSYKNETYFSEGILLINEILPDKRIYVQKEINPYNEDYYKVKIKVKNLGNSFVKDIIISDFFDNNTIIKEISKPFYSKGSWKINKLNPNEEWEVSYLVSKNSNVIENLPNIYGIDSKNVFKSLISSGEIISFYEPNANPFEKVGLIFSIALLIIYLLF